VTRNKGFTLVETLVALVILSAGLLGVAALQFTSLQNNNSAVFRSQATYFAYDIADRMRANRDRVLAGDYKTSYGAVSGTPTNVAQTDVQAWKVALAASLPSGDGEILSDIDGNVTIRIRWDDSKGEQALLVFETQTRI
jgi:type IV pilus assembly protein PilV